MSDYPKTITTNDGLMVYFTCEAEEIKAYNDNPCLYPCKPDCIKDEIIKPIVVEKLMKEVIVPVVEVTPIVEEKKYRGWPKGKPRGK